MTMPMDASDSSAGRSADEALVDEGMRVGAGFDTSNLILVLGEEPRLTALAALGVARAQSLHRRVALGDLLGDAEPIQQLLDGDDPHGLADSFVYGVSLNKIAHAVPQYGELYVLPSGSEVPAYEEIFTNSRWKRLAAGFRETGALLVVAAPASAAHVADVVGLADGAVLVGDAKPLGVDADKVLARVTPPIVADRAPKDTPDAPVVVEPVTAISSDARRDWRHRLRPPSRAMVLGIVLAAALGGIGIWLAARPLASGYEPLWLRRKRTASAAGTVPAALDSLRADSALSRRDTTSLIAADPGDSLKAAAYAVVVRRFNTQAGAVLWFQTDGRDLPASTFSPVLVQGVPWFRALAGSFQTRTQAESLLGTLRQHGDLRPDLGEVVRAPFAFLVDSVKAEAVPGMIKYFVDRGQPVYALRQTDGSARLYAGAFEDAQQAQLFVDAVRASGIRPVLVYRIGRVF